uniref:Cyclin N-terminal domain-containing protein n=1 Tax=Romanomermis culicivorax TaxID=13658 RepID=A0A915HL36_ROMCU
MAASQERQTFTVRQQQKQSLSVSKSTFFHSTTKNCPEKCGFRGLSIRYESSKSNPPFTQVQGEKFDDRPAPFSIFCDDKSKKSKIKEGKVKEKKHDSFVICDDVFAVLTKVESRPATDFSILGHKSYAECSEGGSSSKSSTKSSDYAKCCRKNQLQSQQQMQRLPLATIAPENRQNYIQVFQQSRKSGISDLNLLDISERSPPSPYFEDSENSQLIRDTYSFHSSPLTTSSSPKSSFSVESFTSTSSKCSSNVSYSTPNYRSDHFSSKNTRYEDEKFRHFSLIYAPPDFRQDVYEYAREQEEKPHLKPQKHYFSKQPHIDTTMRVVLVDWMIDVIAEYHMELETLHLAVNYVDRYLSKVIVNKDQLQLVGTTALMIAGKFEEIYPPELEQFAFVTDNTYTMQQSSCLLDDKLMLPGVCHRSKHSKLVVKMERAMLATLNFDFCVPTINFFLEHFIAICRSNQRCTSLAKFLSELILLDSSFLQYSSSVIAASIICVANLTTESVPWPVDLEHSSHYTIKDIYRCMQMVLKAFKAASCLSTKAVIDKYRVDGNRVIAESANAVRIGQCTQKFNKVSSKFGPKSKTSAKKSIFDQLEENFGDIYGLERAKRVSKQKLLILVKFCPVLKQEVDNFKLRNQN